MAGLFGLTQPPKPVIIKTMLALSRGPFRFEYGRSSLNLVSTLRRRRSLAVDLLITPKDFARWLVEAKIITNEPVVTAAQFRRSIELREAIYRIAAALIAGKNAGTADVVIVNRTAARARERLKLQPNFGLRSYAANFVDAALSELAKDAITLFGSPELRELVRACEFDDCGTLFLDESRGRRRRWCSMSRCGSRAKGKAFRARHAVA